MNSKRNKNIQSDFFVFQFESKGLQRLEVSPLSLVAVKYLNIEYWEQWEHTCS